MLLLILVLELPECAVSCCVPRSLPPLLGPRGVAAAPPLPGSEVSLPLPGALTPRGVAAPLLPGSEVSLPLPVALRPRGVAAAAPLPGSGVSLLLPVALRGLCSAGPTNSDCRGCALGLVGAGREPRGALLHGG